jgi:hypothetical protein
MPSRASGQTITLGSAATDVVPTTPKASITLSAVSSFNYGVLL